MLSKAVLACHEACSKAGKPFSLKLFIAGPNPLENDGAKALVEVLGAVKSLEHIESFNGIYHL